MQSVQFPMQQITCQPGAAFLFTDYNQYAMRVQPICNARPIEKRTYYCRSFMGADAPEVMDMDGKSFFNSVLLHATRLSGVAEKQQGQHPQPDAPLAVAGCLRAAALHVSSGLPFVPGPQQCITLMEVASRVMASFAAAPRAGSAASALLLPISCFLTAVSCKSPECTVQQLAGARDSLLASVKLMLEAPSSLLTSEGVTTHGPVIVGETLFSLKYAISIAAWLPGSRSLVDSRLAAQLLKQCQALLADGEIAAQLKEQQRYPLCSLPLPQPLTIAASLALLASGASRMIIECISGMIRTESGVSIALLADCQQQLLALSSAVAQPPHA